MTIEVLSAPDSAIAASVIVTPRAGRVFCDAPDHPNARTTRAMVLRVRHSEPPGSGLS